MKTVLASANDRIDQYILATHQELKILNQSDVGQSCLNDQRELRPEFIILSDKLADVNTWSELFDLLKELRQNDADVKILCLITTRELEHNQKMELKQMLVSYICAPIKKQELSRQIYSIVNAEQSVMPRNIAIWSPKAGDGASTITENIGKILWRNRKSQADKIGILDFNLKAPYIKYRLGLDDVTSIDQAIPYINGCSLTAQLLLKLAVDVPKHSNLKFIGGISRPELQNHYYNSCFTSIFNLASTTFNKTIIDAGSYLDCSPTITALREADLILIVLQPDYVSQRSLRHYLSLFPALGINQNKAKVLINRCSQQENEDLNVIMSGINLETAGVLPDFKEDQETFSAELEIALSKYELCQDKGSKKNNPLTKIFVRGA